MAIDWSEIRHFRRHEFGYWNDVEPDERLVYMLDEARRFSGREFIITPGGGIRGPRYDGDKSAHITGHAADIRCVDSRVRWHMLDGIHAAGFSRIGIYDRHIHVDTDPTKPKEVIWLGKSE